MLRDDDYLFIYFFTDQLGTVAVTGVLKGYRQGSVLSLNITANTKRLLPYVGPLQLSVLRRDGDIVKSVYSQHYMFNETSTTTFALSETGNFNLTFIFENNITRKSADLTVSVAAVGQYSYVRLVFSKTDTHLAHKWFYQLQQAVLSATIQVSTLCNSLASTSCLLSLVCSCWRSVHGKWR